MLIATVLLEQPPDSPWRTVVHGGTECMACADGAVDASCSMDTESAGCCGASLSLSLSLSVCVCVCVCVCV